MILIEIRTLSKCVFDREGEGGGEFRSFDNAPALSTAGVRTIPAIVAASLQLEICTVQRPKLEKPFQNTYKIVKTLNKKIIQLGSSTMKAVISALIFLLVATAIIEARTMRTIRGINQYCPR